MSDKRAQQVHGFLQIVAAARGGVLPVEESAQLADWYASVVDGVQCINLVISGSAKVVWDDERGEPTFDLTHKGANEAGVALGKKGLTSNEYN